MQQGKIISLSGISGIGKSFFKSYILKNKENFQALISVTTRNKRKGEVDGIDKFFYSLEKFEEEKQDDKLCVINEVFGYWYAYKNNQIELCNNGINLITELFYRNVEEFKKEFPNTISIYILPKDIEKTKNQLKLRSSSKEDFLTRLKAMDEELSFFYNNRDLFDIVIENDYTEDSCIMLQEILTQIGV